MNYYVKSISLLFLVIVGLASCEDDTFPSFVTTYPIITINGEDQITLPQGDSFSDPGAEAKVGDADVDVNVNNPVDVNSPGFYTITYTATNMDGFSVSSNRTVIVYEPGSITGLFDGKRVGRSGGPILINSKGNNQYLISDALGGHYQFERNLGPTYAAPLMIELKSDNTFTAMDTFNPGFGLKVVVTEGKRSEDGSIWTWHAEFPDVAFGFDIELTKIK